MLANVSLKGLNVYRCLETPSAATACLSLAIMTLLRNRCDYSDFNSQIHNFKHVWYIFGDEAENGSGVLRPDL